MKQIILIRHGALDESLGGRYIGSTEAELSAAGRNQLQAIGRLLNDDARKNVYASPQLRVRQSVEAAGLDTATAREDERLRETSFGLCEMLTYAEIVERFPGITEHWRPGNADFTFPGGENTGAFRARVRSFLDELLGTPGPVSTIFTHGGVVNALLEFLLEIPAAEIWRYAPERGSISIVKRSESGHASLRLLNFRPGLLENGVTPWQS
mgnify:CR=1 FL=1|jgi:broad specificity phosphatase PhoE